MVGADLFRAVVALVLVVMADSVGVAYAVAFGLSAGAVVFNPAAGSLLPEVVDEDDVVTANSAMWTAAVTGQIALAPLAGFVIAAWGVEVAFAINAATFAVSASLLIGLRAGRTPAEIAVRGWSGVLAGVETVRADPLLARLAVVQVLASMSAGATSGLDRFADTSAWSRLPTGEPVYHGVRAWLRCAIVSRMDAGGSTVIAAQALQVDVERDLEPGEAGAALVYHNRTWHRLGEHSRLD